MEHGKRSGAAFEDEWVRYETALNALSIHQTIHVNYRTHWCPLRKSLALCVSYAVTCNHASKSKGSLMCIRLCAECSDESSKSGNREGGRKEIEVEWRDQVDDVTIVAIQHQCDLNVNRCEQNTSMCTRVHTHTNSYGTRSRYVKFASAQKESRK